MKRSELVNKFKMRISLLSGGMYTDEELNRIACDMIQELEKLGFSPPPIKKKTYVTGLDQNGNPMGWGYETEAWVNEWEDE